jgi:hypothetical protein
MILDLQVFAVDGSGVEKSILCSESVREPVFVAVLRVSLRTLWGIFEEVLTACVCNQLNALEIQKAWVGFNVQLF